MHRAISQPDQYAHDSQRRNRSGACCSSSRRLRSLGSEEPGSDDSQQCERRIPGGHCLTGTESRTPHGKETCLEHAEDDERGWHQAMGTEQT